MSNRDSIHRFLFERHAVRGELVHLNASWAAILERHDYPKLVRDVLGEALGASVLLTSTLKFNGSLTLQLQGDGDLRLLVAQCTSRMTVRGLAHSAPVVRAAPLSDLLGDGRLAITIDPVDDGKRYQGVVPLEGESMAESVENYFERSEQLPTRLWLAANGVAAVGMMLQQLPEQVSPASNVADDDDAWNRLCVLASTLTSEELLGLSDREILHRLFHEEDIRLFESEPVSFRCTCSRKRIASALRGLGEAEVQSIIEEQGTIATSCDFCNKKYSFDSVDAAGLFAGSPGDLSGTQH